MSSHAQIGPQGAEKQQKNVNLGGGGGGISSIAITAKLS